MKEKKLKGLKGFKEILSTKTCPSCNRPFQYRKKWKKNWEEILYCSTKCKRKRPLGTLK